LVRSIFDTCRDDAIEGSSGLRARFGRIHLVKSCAKIAEPQIANFAYGRPGAARNLVDHFRRRSRVDDHHTLNKALAAFKAALLPASADSLNGK
jgi:hypothetical protein